MELAQYLHAGCFYPVRSIFEKSIKMDQFKIWPGLIMKILKDLPISVAIVQGHIHQERKNLKNITKPNLTSQSKIDTLRKKLDFFKK